MPGTRPADRDPFELPPSAARRGAVSVAIGLEARSTAVVRIAGDSGDGIQLAGSRFTSETALAGNGLATLPDYPAEIRAPAGSLSGVSSFQIQFGDHPIATAGDRLDALVAMGPAALKANLDDLPIGSTLIVNTDEFTARNLTKAGYLTNPLTDGTLADRYQLQAISMGALTREALRDSGLSSREIARTKTMFALGLLTWMYGRSGEHTVRQLRLRFADNPKSAEGSVSAFHAGHAYGETTEAFAAQIVVGPADMPSGRYRQISGNRAVAYGLIAAAHLAGLRLFYGSYPITPASDILHELARRGSLGVTTFQAEDEIAAIGAALGAAYGGCLAATATSGPGMALKAEMLGLAVALELPLVVVDVQRSGPSTGMPTRTEQADLLHALYGRSGEAPLPVLAARSPADCFDAALEAARIAITYRTPVILLSDGSLANGAEPWRVPRLGDLPGIDPEFATHGNAPDGSGAFWPYLRKVTTGARPWAVPGTPGLQHRIGGLEKSDGSGGISQDPENHEHMVRARAAKVDGVAVATLTIDDPDQDAELLVLSWGSTHGPATVACQQVRLGGHKVASGSLRHLNPLPPNLARILDRYSAVLVPELNTGQLAFVLAGKLGATPRTDGDPGAQPDTTTCAILSHTKVTGRPFTSEELTDVILKHITDSPASATLASADPIGDAADPIGDALPRSSAGAPRAPGHAAHDADGTHEPETALLGNPPMTGRLPRHDHPHHTGQDSS